MVNHNKYVVAIDLGTSRTGFAWSVMNTFDTDKVYMCVKWPAIGTAVPKTNSAILLNEKGELIFWGFEAIKNYDPNENYFFDRVKMDLYDPDSNRSRGIKIVEDKEKGPYRVIEIENKYGNKEEKHIYAVDLISMILSSMKNEAISNIYETMGKIESKDDISKSILWVITVPASATDAQKYLMRKAAIKAKLINSSTDDQENLLLAYEPEMAALYYRNRTKNLGIFNNEHIMVVVDAGGGTVDVSAHKYNPISGFGKLDQIVEPRKSYSGSTYLDNMFIQHLVNLFSKEVIVAFSKEKKNEWHYLLFNSNSSWENSKRNFTLDMSKTPIDIRDIEYFIQENTQYQTDHIKVTLENIKMHQIMLSKDVFKDEICSPVFANSLKPINDVLRELEKKGLKCDILFFAGGLACSQFFVEYIKEAIGKQVITYGEGLFDVERESAILKGAVLFGNDPSKWFGSRISQWTYGINIRTKYDEKIHNIIKAKIVDDCRGYKAVNNGFYTIVSKGQSVKVNEKFESEFCPSEPKQSEIAFRILASRKNKVIYSDEDELVKLDQIDIPISGEGLNRSVTLSLEFGQTEIKAKCIEKINPTNKITTTFNFPWDYNQKLSEN